MGFKAAEIWPAYFDIAAAKQCPSRDFLSALVRTEWPSYDGMSGGGGGIMRPPGSIRLVG